jgi:DNA-binding GntR family transcriptional regulator
MTLSDIEIQAWSRDRSVARRIAASLAVDIKAGKFGRYAELPPTFDLAVALSVSTSTVGSAKRLLFDQGLLKKAKDGSFYVA